MAPLPGPIWRPIPRLGLRGGFFGCRDRAGLQGLAGLPIDCEPDAARGRLQFHAEAAPDGGWHDAQVAHQRRIELRREPGDPSGLLYAFDALAIGKRDLRPATLIARRAALQELFTPSPHLQRPDLWNDGVALLGAATKLGLEGVVGKRLDSPYVKGRSVWLKVRASTAREQTRR